MTESFHDNEFDTLAPNPQVHTPHSYRLFEPIPIGDFVIHLWCSAKPKNVPVQDKRTKTRVMVSSYLPQGTNGVRVPNFKSTLCYDNSQATLSRNPGPPKHSMKPNPFIRSRSQPIHVLRPPQISSEPDSPQLLSCDPSDYMSPFTFHHTRSYSTPSILEHQTPSNDLFKRLPNFIADAPENFVWGVIMYKDGEKVNPVEDAAFTDFQWSKVDGCTAWEDKHFTKADISEILLDLYAAFDEMPHKVHLEYSLQTPAPGIPKHILSERNIFLDLARSVSYSSSPVTNLYLEQENTACDLPEKVQSDDAPQLQKISDPNTPISLMDVNNPDNATDTQFHTSNNGFEFSSLRFPSVSVGNFNNIESATQFNYIEEPEWDSNDSIPNWKFDLKKSLTAF